MSDRTVYNNTEPANTREAIMHATYNALLKHGYSGLSISRIADESNLSKSTLYHHFDDKDDLLLSFTDFTIAEFGRGFEHESAGTPVEDLYAYLNVLLGIYPIERDRPADVERMSIWIELRSQAIHDPTFAEKFTETTDKYIEQFTEIIAEGIEQGVFYDVDPEKTATFLLVTVDGAILNMTTRNDDLRQMVWEKMDEYIKTNLIRGETDDVYPFADSIGLADDAE
jgi:AcrR family transcriptional regulator